MPKLKKGDRVKIAEHAKNAAEKLNRYTDQTMTVSHVETVTNEDGSKEVMITCSWEEGTYGTVERNPPFHETDLDLV